jgi:hypothetical protein
MQDSFDELFNELEEGCIITDTFNYYRVISFFKSGKAMFGVNLIHFHLQEVRFNHNQWDWVNIGVVFENEYLPLRVSVAKPVDYVLLGDRLKDKNGNFTETYLGIEENDFDDIEQKTRFMLDDKSLYIEFRKKYHIVDRIKTTEAYTEEVLKHQEEEDKTERLKRIIEGI